MKKTLLASIAWLASAAEDYRVISRRRHGKEV